MRAACLLWLGLIAVPARAVQVSTAPFEREILIHGTGDDDTDWRSAPQPIQPGRTYQLSFQARSLSGGGGGTVTSGPSFCNRDLGEPGPAWREYATVFVAPAHLAPEDAVIMFGQWYRRGEVAVKDIAFDDCQPVYASRSGFELGDGEQVSGSLYEFHGPGGGLSGNHARVLASHDCPFNSNRWTFRAGANVVYRHTAGGRPLTAATVTVGVTYHVSGTLLVEASRDGAAWLPLGTLTGVASRALPIPAALLPTSALWIRLGARDAGGTQPPEFQVAAYALRAVFAGPRAALVGRTQFVTLAGDADASPAAFEALGDQRPGGDNAVRLRIRRDRPQPHSSPVTVRAWRDGVPVGATPYTGLLERHPRPQRFPYPVAGPGHYRVEVRYGPGLANRADFRFSVPTLYDDSFGAIVPGSSAMAGLWTCSSGWKVSEARGLPTATGEAVTIFAARGETEAAQLVVRPAKPMTGFRAIATSLTRSGTRSGDALIPSAAIDLLQVRYVPVEEPSDETGGAGRWPDPLPPLTTPLRLAPGVNQPIWVRVRVPRGTPHGTYTGEIRLSSAGWQAAVPLLVEVFDFDLPERMTLDTSFGFEPRLAFQYQGARNDADRRKLLDLYYANLAAHHIAPFAYDTAPMDPFVTTWTHTADGQGPTPAIDWSAWDREMTRLLDTYQFGPFAFPVPGMYGGGGDERPLLAGFREGSTGYTAAFSRWCALAQAHLQEKGWLDRAYVYWYDEPQDRAMAFVMNGMRRLKAHLPGVRRMITEEPRPELNGGVDLWCPVLDAWDPVKVAERRRLGERFWWYICTGPKAPFVGEFIDRQSADLRVWCWQTWDQDVKGILIWATDYWTTASAYPESGPPQNPYEDSMSWEREAPPGVKRGWGNGDGRLIYPPLAGATGRPGRFLPEGPVDSIRWEHLRDGIEDYEYLAILKRKLAAEGAALPSWRQRELAELLKVPEELSKTLTDWTKDDAMILSRRAEIARAIENIRGHPDH